MIKLVDPIRADVWAAGLSKRVTVVRYKRPKKKERISSVYNI